MSDLEEQGSVRLNGAAVNGNSSENAAAIPKGRTGPRLDAVFARLFIFALVAIMFLLAFVSFQIRHNNNEESDDELIIGTIGDYGYDSIPEITAGFSDPSADVAFLVLGDWGRKGQYNQTELARTMNTVCARSDPPCQFVISVGDNFYSKGVNTVNDSDWEESFLSIYRSPDLPVIRELPFYCALGDNDYLKNAGAQVEYSHLHSDDQSRWIMPSRYYRVIKEFASSSNSNSSLASASDPLRAMFLFTDTTPFIQKYYGQDDYRQSDIHMQNTTEQLEFIKESLALGEEQRQQGDSDSDNDNDSDSDSDSMKMIHWKVVIGHHPLYSATVNRSNAELISTFRPLLEQPRQLRAERNYLSSTQTAAATTTTSSSSSISKAPNVAAYFCGHDHNMQAMHSAPSNTRYYIAGAGSKVKEDPHAASMMNATLPEIGGSGGSSSGVRMNYFYDKSSSFVYVTMSKGRMVSKFVNLRGEVYYADQIVIARNKK